MRYENKFCDGIYSMVIECDNVEYGEIKIWFNDSEISSDHPMLFLELTPLWHFNDEEKEDNKRYKNALLKDEYMLLLENEKYFKEGDYYQSSMDKFREMKPKSISYMAILHDILIKNSSQLPFIKRIFSTSKNQYKWEKFITSDAIRFWEKQLMKGYPFAEFPKDKRYLLNLN